jgi:MFS family permease
MEVLAALAGEGATPESSSVQAQYRIIKDVLDREHVSTYKWHEVLSGKGPPGLLRRMVLGAWMLAMTQLSGINITSYYMTYVFIHALNFSVLRSRILSATGSIVYLIFSILAYGIIERWGRRTVIMISSFGCAVCWVMVTIMQALAVSDPIHSQAYGIVAVVFFFVFWAAFGMGLLPVPWLYPTEINALEKRTMAAAVAVCTNWLLNYMVAEVTPLGIATLGWWFWIIWAVICAAFIPIVYFFYPETANRSLEDIDRFFESRPGVLVHRNRLAIQLQRPDMYEDEDVRIGHELDPMEKIVVSGAEHEECVKVGIA